MTRRILTPEEAQLWQQVTRHVVQKTTRISVPSRTAYSLVTRPKTQTHTGKVKVRISTLAQENKRRPITLGQAAMQDGDPNQARRVAKGRIPIEATLDLHGLYQEEAYERLCHFLRSAQEKKQKCVLVITGKGAPGTKDMAPHRVTRGILRHRFLAWVEEAPLRHSVIAIRQAHLKHGGTGAFYVFLRNLNKYTA